MAFLQRFIGYLRRRLEAAQVVHDTPTSFLADLQAVRSRGRGGRVGGAAGGHGGVGPPMQGSCPPCFKGGRS